jgi:hypothetical protein
MQNTSLFICVPTLQKCSMSGGILKPQEQCNENFCKKGSFPHWRVKRIGDGSDVKDEQATTHRGSKVKLYAREHTTGESLD